MIGDNLTTSVLEKGLDGTWKRQQAVASNISNHETPNYKAVKVGFESALDRAVHGMSGSVQNKGDYERGLKNIKDSNISIGQDATLSERADGNNVNLEQENIDMAKTQIQYNYLVRQMTDMFTRLRYAIREGK